MPRCSREDIKGLHLEYLVTRQVSTGMGQVFLPQVHERSVSDDRPPSWFTRHELGLAPDSSDDVLSTALHRKRRNRNRREALAAARKKLDDQARALGIPVKPRTPSDAGHDEFDHRPLRRKPRLDTHERRWLPYRNRRTKRTNGAQRAADYAAKIDAARKQHAAQ